jgi:tRNA(adenine34) deaminase
VTILAEAVKPPGMTGFPLPAPMARALALAAEAAAAGEVPVGAVVTHGKDIVGEARNAMRGTLDPTAHAEIVAIRHAATRLGQARLDGCTLWVTLEPCAMCAAAIGFARIERLYYGAADAKGGGVDHGARVFAHATCHHAPEVYGGIAEVESAAMLADFFAARR